jgi:Holliday junction DNA helicase RuvB
VDELPAELTAKEWQELEGRLEWSPSQHAFLLGPEGDLGPSSDQAPPAGEKTPERPSARPRSFAEFVGQRRVVENLLIASRAAEARGEPLGHVLLNGAPGLGKTSLARLLAAERGATIQEVVGAHLEDPHQLISLLARIEKGGFLVIDEIHALGSACEEALYTALEDGLVEVVVRDRVRARVIRVRLEPFTLVGATTRLGALSEPFRARFKLRETLEPYGEEELSEIALRAARRLGAETTPEAALAVARRSRGTPREAIRLLERARDLAQVAATGSSVVHHVVHEIQFSHVVHGAARLGIDERGLSREDRAVVRLLIERGRPVGLEAIASRLGLDLETLRDVHEPWLERSGLVERTERGRVATAKAIAWYCKPNPGGSSDSGGDSGGPSPPPGPQGAPPRWGIPVLRLHSA